MNKINLNITPRKEGTRELKKRRYINLELENIKAIFIEDVQSIKSMEDFIDSEKMQYMQLVFQSQIVLLESAFDFYLHNITKYGIAKIHNGDWEKTEKYDNLTINLKTFESVINDTAQEDWLMEYMSKAYSKITMISYETFKDQLNLIGIPIEDIAFTVAGENHKNRSDDINALKEKINAAYKFRNSIAHQSHRSHIDANVETLEHEDVISCIENIEEIVNAIHNCMEDKG